ncbi:hypothetical protein D3C87_1964710 [compost metagenome]
MHDEIELRIQFVEVVAAEGFQVTSARAVPLRDTDTVGAVATITSVTGAGIKSAFLYEVADDASSLRRS